MRARHGAPQPNRISTWLLGVTFPVVALSLASSRGPAGRTRASGYLVAATMRLTVGAHARATPRVSHADGRRARVAPRSAGRVGRSPQVDTSGHMDADGVGEIAEEGHDGAGLARGAHRPCSPAQELEKEPDRTQRFDRVFDVGRDGLHLTRTHNDIDPGARLRPKAKLPLLHTKPAPRSIRHAVRATECGRHGLLIPHGGRSHHVEVTGQLRPIAQRTVQRRADPSSPSVVVRHPRCKPEGWLVTHVLTMQARKLGHPLTRIVVAESDDRALHCDERTDRRRARRAPQLGIRNLRLR